jgi:hypothetical protein
LTVVSNSNVLNLFWFDIGSGNCFSQDKW